MKLEEYEVKAMRTKSPAYMGNRDRSIQLAALKLCGEAGEIANKIGKAIEAGKDISHGTFLNNLKLEAGDLQWHLTLFVNLIGSTLEEVMTTNIDKLQRRHEDGFNPNYRKEKEKE